MRFKKTLILELIIPFFIAFLLAGCFGDGGGPTYDGTWKVGYTDSGFSAGSGVVCTVSNPPATITLANGVGSTTQIDYCTPGPNYLHLISVAVTTSTGVVNAIVNGAALTGQCISAVGCAAQSGTKSLSLTR
jgi:hypothetical protein